MRSRQHRLLQRIAALCLHFPDAELFAQLPLARAAAAELPAAPRETVLALVDGLERLGPVAAGARYVELFDTKPGRCLHLTWYTDGDTRRRGGSLARLKQEFREQGFELTEGELPDYLPVLLEFAALTGTPGRDLLVEFRPAIDRLHQALSTVDVEYTGLVGALLSTVPLPRKGVRTVSATPPVEQVGMEPVLLGYPTTRAESHR
ncbi:nitrate reductase molybdenum cofactor assembly chaperone [Crossiella sp. CA-258035]|uniref:nitrate reductase molybdenum cofactor assembly chaperone n=1 Tax=Crossiella sp. CA-258035 TaxID=2981138 RepID=UPI0024BBEC59|nr:nitrate reductase molybdenum cofactor assembly chaperone [Crossiella sp. CA-258035]WHT16498.1 nitrate reductase molybdenum cofactor assembly chaperone [Crossiella sp. CA-258035]